MHEFVPSYLIVVHCCGKALSEMLGGKMLKGSLLLYHARDGNETV